MRPRIRPIATYDDLYCDFSYYWDLSEYDCDDHNFILLICCLLLHTTTSYTGGTTSSTIPTYPPMATICSIDIAIVGRQHGAVANTKWDGTAGRVVDVNVRDPRHPLAEGSARRRRAQGWRAGREQGEWHGSGWQGDWSGR